MVVINTTKSQCLTVLYIFRFVHCTAWLTVSPANWAAIKYKQKMISVKVFFFLNLFNKFQEMEIHINWFYASKWQLFYDWHDGSSNKNRKTSSAYSFVLQCKIANNLKWSSVAMFVCSSFLFLSSAFWGALQCNFFFHWMSLDNDLFLLLSLCPWHDHDNNIVCALLVVSFVAVYSVLGCSWTMIRRKFTCDRRRRQDKNEKHNDYDDRTEFDIAKLLRN